MDTTAIETQARDVLSGCATIDCNIPGHIAAHNVLELLREREDPQVGSWIRTEDVNRLVRELDVAWNGEKGAAPQAALCDIVGQIINERRNEARSAAKVRAIGYLINDVDDQCTFSEAGGQARRVIPTELIEEIIRCSCGLLRKTHEADCLALTIPAYAPVVDAIENGETHAGEVRDYAVEWTTGGTVVIGTTSEALAREEFRAMSPSEYLSPIQGDQIDIFAVRIEPQ